MSAPPEVQDLFISHASDDKPDYVLPLAAALSANEVSYWLDGKEISWGDGVVSKINQGLGECRYMLLCLSKNVIGRGWVENEMGAALAIQSDTGRKKLLPLILNSKDEVFRAYPLLNNLLYKEFSQGPDALAAELAALVGKTRGAQGLIRVVLESVHTEKLFNLKISPRVSVPWLLEKAEASAGVRKEASFGAAVLFKIRWVLIDARAEAEWNALGLEEQQQIQAVVKSESGVKFSYVGSRDRLESLGAYDGIVFHLRGIDDNPRRFTKHSQQSGGGGGSSRGFGGGGIDFMIDI